ncbi:MAG: hypothetical protein RI907_4028 [Pseudomonadota bacterium]|jgi:hypothetical protein
MLEQIFLPATESPEPMGLALSLVGLAVVLAVRRARDRNR